MQKPIPLGKLERIVVFRTDHIGDLIVSTPFLRALRQAAPQAQLLAVVPRVARDVLEDNPSVDEVMTLEEWAAAPGSSNHDLAIALSPRTATYQLVAATKARYRAGYYYPERLLTRLARRVWLTHAFPMAVRKPLDAGLKVPHEIEQQAQFAEFLGFTISDKSPLLPVSSEDLQWGREEGQGRLAVHLSPNWFSRGWTVADFAQMCQGLPPFFVTYGHAEAPLAEQLRLTPGWTASLYGKLNLKHWAAILAAAQAVISTDTGAVHVAAAHARPVIIVYKPEQFELCSQQWYPWGVDYRSLVQGDTATTASQIQQALAELLGIRFEK